MQTGIGNILKCSGTVAFGSYSLSLHINSVISELIFERKTSSSFFSSILKIVLYKLMEIHTSQFRTMV